MLCAITAASQFLLRCMMAKLHLHEYQRAAINELLDKERQILVAPMGAGKTVILAETAVALVKDELRVLIVAPKRVVDEVWAIEPQRWNLRPFTIIKGNPTQRREITEKFPPIAVINYELLNWLEKMCPDYLMTVDVIMYDEVTRLKTHNSTVSRTAMRLAPDRSIIGATGTLLPNGDYQEIFACARAVDPAIFGRAFTTWRKKYFYPTDYNQWNWALFEGADKKIETAIAPWVYPISIAEVNYEQPKVMTIDHGVELLPSTRDFYDKMENQLFVSFGDSSATAAHEAAIGLKCLQMAGGAVYTDDEGSQVHQIGTEKLESLAELVLEAKPEPVAVAYWFRHELARLLDWFPGAMETREPGAVEMWNKGQLPMLLMHPGSAGHGLNLQHGGRRLIWYTLPWSGDLYRQTIARFARQGQEKDTVYNYRLLAKNTIEATIADVLEGKETRQQDFLAALRAA